VFVSVVERHSLVTVCCLQKGEREDGDYNDSAHDGQSAQVFSFDSFHFVLLL
jgi:basic membrane lipoprotein Med (substrate-binding protein (PBP1-ABC) superfamily)